MPPDRPLPTCNYFALRQAMRSIGALYDSHFAQAGVTGPQYSILSVANGNPGIATQDMADRLVMDRTTLLRALAPMVRDGLLTQSPAPDHPRKQVITLTGAGEAKYAEAQQHWEQAQAEFEAAFGTGQAEALRTTLFGLTRSIA